MANANIMKIISDKTFSDVLQSSSKPVVILFTTSYSGLSKIMMPRIEEVGRHFADKIDLYNAPCEDSKNFIARFGIRVVPTIAIFKNNALVGIRVNVISKEQLISFINSQI